MNNKSRFSVTHSTIRELGATEIDAVAGADCGDWSTLTTSSTLTTTGTLTTAACLTTTTTTTTTVTSTTTSQDEQEQRIGG